MSRPHPWEASYPPGLAWDVALPSGSLPALLDRAVAAFGARPAISFRERSIGFAELGARVDRLARGLAAAGVCAGEAVGLLLPNSPAHPIAFFAVLRLGARVVHLTPLDPPRAVRRKLLESGARTLISTDLPGVLPTALDVADAVDRLIVAADAEWGPGSESLPSPPGVLEMSALDGPAVVWPTIEPGDVALLQFTGGTTGHPRAAMLTHANLTATVSIYDAWNEGIGRAFRMGDRILCVLPLFHIYALTAVLLRSLANGVELVLRPRFVLEQVLGDIETGRCTHLNGVPTMWIALVNAPGVERRDLSALRVASSGGAGLPHEVGERFRAMTGVRIGGGWGMTETAPAGTNLLPDRAQEAGEIGVPLPGVALQIVSLDDSRSVLPAGEVGELRVRGPNVMVGYWGRPEETAAAFVDGWFLTGDMARMEADGRFVLVDRKKDMIISGGFNVYPRAIEDAIHEHPDVREAAVIGVPDAYRGQAAKAFVVLREAAPDLTLEALRAFLGERIGRHELPAALAIRESLPHTAVGKLAKRELMEE